MLTTTTVRTDTTDHITDHDAELLQDFIIFMDALAPTLLKRYGIRVSIDVV